MRSNWWKNSLHAWRLAVLTDESLRNLLFTGLSPHLQERSQLRRLTRGWLDPQSNTLEMDLLWLVQELTLFISTIFLRSDPDPRITGFRPSTRGCSCLFGPDVIRETCRRLDVDLIVRAHQVVQDGYEMSPTRQLITLFSAPNYCGEVFIFIVFKITTQHFSSTTVVLQCSWTSVLPVALSSSDQSHRRDDY